MRFVIGADEYDAVLDLIEEELRSLGHDVTRIGAKPDAPAPWGSMALEIGRRVASGEADQGVACCYTGTGVSMAANKVPGVRAALCVDAETARGARQWNDANVLALSLRLTSPTVAKEIVHAWANAAYGGTEGPSLEAMRVAERSRS
ncbi:MAG TPA: RpiB/LacA/LacB family sugar-phosphate isomerase [Polyangiaceae bacterium]